jgi:HEPN domain-containing protein
MAKVNSKQLIKYWQTIAAHDYEVMLDLYKSRHYPESLFFGHTMLEKILKAHVVRVTKKQAAYTHDLVRLQEIAQLNLPPENISLLNQINDFNLRSRYPEYKLEFYKLCTAVYTKRYIKQITELYNELCQKLKQKQ